MKPISPNKIKALRIRRGHTQQSLTDATSGHTKVSIATIKRIESAKMPREVRDHIAIGLAKVLRVSVEELAPGAPEQEIKLDDWSARTVKATVDNYTSQGLAAVEHLYGIDEKYLIEMIPLFVTILAEASLAWRRTRVDAIEAKVDELMNLGAGSGHLAFVRNADAILEAVATERKSIEQRDLFGEQASVQAREAGYDPSESNPFSDYLAYVVRDIGLDEGVIELMPGGGWLDDHGLPEYLVHSDFIDEITDSDELAEFALGRGHVRFRDIPSELMGDERKHDRVEWLRSQIPPSEMERLTEKDERSGT